MDYPKKISHWIGNEEVLSSSGRFFQKYNPANGKILAEVTRGNKSDVELALNLAVKAFEEWTNTNIIKRSEILREAAFLIRERKDEIGEIVALESGKPKRDALTEVNSAIECGFFMAGEGRRYFGETLTSSQLNRSVMMIRQSIGVGVLITPFNNPSAAVAWKIFPALLCGNTVVMKAHEDTPYVPIWFTKIFKEVGLPSGVLSIIQGLGSEVGPPLIENKRVKFIAFTGSLNTAKYILRTASERLVKTLIETGGKNPFVVCDDADLEKVATLAVASAFVDAGQRCAAASRLIIFDSIYDEFKKIFLDKVAKLKVGIGDNDDFGAIINEKRLLAILRDIKKAEKRGAKILTGGYRLEDEIHRVGYFIAPTVLENVSPKDEISYKELFGPVVILYRVKDFEEAVRLANDPELKLTGAIHTKSINRAQEFIKRYQAGVVRVNGPTHGSEPHMPFGGVGLSGTGWREPGKAIDFYSDWKQVSIDHEPKEV